MRPSERQPLTGAPRSDSRTSPKGFTLAEMLMAIMILAIGLSMVAAIFPAAMTYTQQSSAEVLGNIVCQNGLALARAMLIHSTTSPPFTNKVTENTTLDTLRVYPIGTGDGATGFLVFGRQVTANRNDYQIIVVAYRKSAAGNPVTVCTETPTTPPAPIDNRYKITFASGANIQAGTVAIVTTNGAYARVPVSNPPDAILETRIDPPLNTPSVFVVKEDGLNVKRSPVIGVMVTRTALRDGG